MIRRLACPACLLVVLVLSSTSRSAQPPLAGAAVILDTAGFWRMHHTLSLPLIRFDDGLRPALPAGSEVDGWRKILASPTPGPARDWKEPAFDDSLWYRGTGGAACRTPFLERLCLRGKFTVTDPQRVRDLAVSLDFYGGAVVYVNGQEIARDHLKASAQPPLADDYPLEAFVQADGKLIALRGGEVLLRKDANDQDTPKRIESRTRTLRASVPPGSLRKGLNVLAIEIVRAPYHKVLDGLKVTQTYKSKELTHDLSWNTCELRRVQLTAAGMDGLVSSAVRPQGLQVWNSPPLATDFDMDFGDPAEPLYPIALTAARNAAVSGKVVVGSTAPIQGLKAAASDLAGPGGAKIAASQVRVRYASRWGVCRTSTEGCFDTTAYPADAQPLYALLDAPLPEFPVYDKKPPAPRAPGDPASITRNRAEPFLLSTPGQPAFVSGAVVPVWITVKVPKDAKPGLYKGTLALQAGGQKLPDVPVEVKIADWAVPDPADYWTWVDLVQSPDVLSLEYKTPLWSDKHFELIGKSMKLIAEGGGRILYVPLMAHTNLGNAESMVRWIRKPSGGYDYDFTVIEKYLDEAAKAGVKPRVIELNVWDLYTFQAGGKGGRFTDAEVGGMQRQKGERGPLVTVLDPATGKTENVQFPTYADPNSKALWRPLFAQLRERLRKRGLEGAMMLGMITDDWCSKDQVQFFKDVGADLPWFSASHGRHADSNSLYGIASVGYQAHAFGVEVAYVGSLRGWARPGVNTLYERWGGFPFTMPTRWRAFAEYAVTGNTRGIGRVGADFWQAVPGRDGRGAGFVWQRYPEASWSQLSLTSSAFAPGPDGAVSTPRWEAMREGVQDAEARIVLERALGEKAGADKLGPDLIKKCQAALDERHNAMWISVATLQMGPAPEHAFSAWRGCYYAGVTGYRWFQGSPWQERSERLYNLAGEVSRKLGAR